MPSVVAKSGDVTATAGSAPFKPATEGKWTPGPVTYKTYSNLSISGTKVIYEAECTFSFAGTTAPPASAPVAGSSTVKLTAGTTLLQKGANNVLKDGDLSQDSYGNTLKVSASGAANNNFTTT